MTYVFTQTLDWYLKWSACMITLAGALCTAMSVDPLNVHLLSTGAAIYLWWSWRIREWSLITINVLLLSINLYGTVVRLT